MARQKKVKARATTAAAGGVDEVTLLVSAPGKSALTRIIEKSRSALDPRDEQTQSADPEGQRIDWVPYPHALRLLQERHQSTPEEIAIWVSLGEDAGGLNGVLDAPMHESVGPIDLDTVPRCSFDRLPDETELLPHLTRAYFDRAALDRFVPQERYITHDRAVGLLAPFAGNDSSARALLRARAVAGELDGLHPITVVTQHTHGVGDDPDYAPLESGMFRKSEIEKLIASNFPDGKAADTKTETMDERDRRLQARAQELFEEGLRQNPSKRHTKYHWCTLIFEEEKFRSKVAFDRLMRVIKKPKPSQRPTPAIASNIFGVKT